MEGFDRYWLFICLSFLMMAVFSLLAFWAEGNPSSVIVGIFGSLAVLLSLNSYVYYSLNGYNLLEDIKGLNQKIDKHNKQIDQLKGKVKTNKQALTEGVSKFISQK